MAKMIAYRLYFLDGAGHVQRTRELKHENDDQAIDQAAAVDHPYGLELWSGGRLIWRFAERVVFKKLIVQRLSAPTNELRRTTHHQQWLSWFSKFFR